MWSEQNPAGGSEQSEMPCRLFPAKAPHHHVQLLRLLSPFPIELNMPCFLQLLHKPTAFHTGLLEIEA